MVGATGIGNSRLAAEFAERVGGGAGVHWGRCLPYGEGITYWPVTEIVKSAAGILQSDDRATTVTKLDAFIDGLPTKDPDELRTLTPAGHEQARALGVQLRADGVQPDAVLSSPLLRARETAADLGFGEPEPLE